MPAPTRPRIPVHLTPLVGRERDLHELATLWQSRRLVTLVGAGGIGKTRLATALAARDGERVAAWADFSGVDDPGVVPSVVATALGIRDEPGRVLLDRIVEALGDDDALLVLDTCEHVLAAVTQLADHLLRVRGGLRILATSRQALGIAGEQVWLVPPLPCDGGVAGDAEAAAVQLFAERASDALPGFRLSPENREAVHRIVCRLEGVPLAIELAAARVKLLPPEQLARRLDDAFSVLTTRSELVLARHRTLRALIDWSHDLLAPAERLAFARLSVFAGGFSLEAAEAVLGHDGIARAEVLDLVAALVDKSLAVASDCRGEARYRLRDTVRQYAHERLAATEGAVANLRRRHAAYFLHFAERAAAAMHGPDQLRWLARLDEDHDNIRLALRWCLDASETDLARRLCLALRDFWRVRGHLGEGRRWIEETLAQPGLDDAMRARALVWAAVLSRMLGDHEAFRQAASEGAALARQVGDRVALADALTNLGVDLRDRALLDEATASLDEAIAIWRDLDDTWGLTLALCVRSSIAHAGGDLARSRALRLEAVATSRAAGDREGEARALIGLGEVARIEGDSDGALTYYERSLALFRELGDAWHCAAVSHNLGWIFAETGQLAAAHAAFEECEAAFARAGNRVGIALCLAGFARILLERGDAETAAVSLAAADERFYHEGVRPSPADHRAWERTRVAIERVLGPDRMAQLAERGRAQGAEESAAWAREKLQMSDDSLRTSGTFPIPGRASVPTPEVRDAEASIACDPGAALRVLALGPLRVMLGDRPLGGEAFGSSKPRELLVLLLCHRDGLSREQVGLTFWPDSTAAQVKNRFHVTLHRLRKALDHPEWIVAAGERYRIDPALHVDFDAGRFERDVTGALRLRSAHQREERLQRLAAALSLYRGDFLDGETVGDWHLEWRDRLQVLYLEARTAQGETLAALERWDEAVVAWRAILARDPLHEEACRRLMEGLAALGDRSQALHVYHELAAALERDLDVEPDARTTALFLRLQGDRATAAA